MKQINDILTDKEYRHYSAMPDRYRPKGINRRLIHYERERENEIKAREIEKRTRQDMEDEERTRIKYIADSADPTALTPREKVFADAIISGESKRDAAVMAYGTPDKKANQKAMIVMRRERVMAYLARHARGAAERLIRLSETAESESVRLDANQDILDRAGVAQPKNPEVVVNITAIDIMRRMGFEG